MYVMQCYQHEDTQRLLFIILLSSSVTVESYDQEE